MPNIKSDKRYCLTADRSRVVAETDPDADTLLVGAGCEIDANIARRYGIHPDQLEHAIVKPEPIADEPIADKKALEAPPIDKSVKSAAEKK